MKQIGVKYFILFYCILRTGIYIYPVLEHINESLMIYNENPEVDFSCKI